MVRSLTLVAAVTAAAIAFGCTRGEEKGRPTVLRSDEDDLQPVALQKDLPKPVDFDGEHTVGYLKAVCAIGPRMSGTKGMKKQQELIKEHFEKLKIPVRAEEFKAKQVSKDELIPMTNLIASIHPDKKRRVILCTHYDTRPIADQEPDERKWRETFLSANDGGSGVAWLMEIAHHLKDLKMNVGVDLVFFDGEEHIWDNREDRDRYFFGSQHFAKTWSDGNRQPNYVAAVLLDMIAGADPKFPVEGFSWARYPQLCNDIWNIAPALGCKAFKREIGDHVRDDHTKLQEVGIPAIDIIDFHYPHWHKLSDVPENCNPDGMLQVSKVLSVWLQRVK